MELQAITGRLYVIDGEARAAAEVPGLLTQSAPAKAARGRDRDFLFVHLTLTGKIEETVVLTQDLLDLVGHHFFRSSGSVTAALRQALLKANEQLLRLNLSGTAPNREGAITCAAFHNGELFMVQTGESLALLGHNFGVERLPPKPPERVTPLGRTAGLDLRFFHHRLQPGDMLLMADPRIAYLPTQTLAPALVDTEVEFGLEALAEIVGDDTSRLLLVEFTDQAPADLPEITRPSRAAGEALATVPQPLPRRAREDSSPAAGEISSSLEERQPSRPTRSPSISSITPPDIDVQKKARQATSDAAMGLSRFTDWVVDLLSRLRPPRPAEGETRNWALPALIALVIPVVVAVVVSSVYLQRGRVRRFAEIKIEMGQALAQAESAEIADVARGHYTGILTLATEAEALRPNDDEIDRLRQQAYAALDRLDEVTRLDAHLFYQYEESVDLAAVVLREGFNGGIYTLDAANNVVYEHQTDETYLEALTLDPERILFAGQAVGNHVVETVTDMMWRPRGTAVSRDGLAVLDGKGALLSYYPNFADIRSVPLGFASDWRLPLAITSFDERLYILDAGANEIWKYYPDGDGFILNESERSIFFDEDPGLAGAIDFSIYSEDGSLALLFGDGRLRYYDTRSGRVQWDETHLAQNGLNAAMVAPASLKMVGRGLNASIFIADAGSGRIIQISRGGTILAQYRATDEEGRELFARAGDFAVAETPLRIFVAAGNALYVATQE